MHASTYMVGLGHSSANLTRRYYVENVVDVISDAELVRERRELD